MYKNRPYRGRREERNRKIRQILLVVVVVFAVLFSVGVFQDLSLSDLSHAGDSQKPAASQGGQTSEPEVPVGSHTIYLPAASLDSSAVQRLIAMKDAGLINGVITDLKNQDGTLNYPSQISYLSGRNIATQAASTLPTSIQTLKEAGVSVIGRIYCYHDNTFAHINKDATACTKKGFTWLDNRSKRHLDPYSDTSADYIGQIIGEAADLGCSEVILDDFSFPTSGQVQYIYYDDQGLSKSEILAQRLQQFVQIGQEKKIEVSLYLASPTENGGIQADAGQDTATFYDVVSHLYAPLSAQSTQGEKDFSQTLAQITGDADKLIPIYTDLQAFPKRFTQDGSPDNYSFDPVNNGYTLNGLYNR
jgi:hypothetical protein